MKIYLSIHPKPENQHRKRQRCTTPPPRFFSLTLHQKMNFHNYINISLYNYPIYIKNT